MRPSKARHLIIYCRLGIAVKRNPDIARMMIMLIIINGVALKRLTLGALALVAACVRPLFYER